VTGMRVGEAIALELDDVDLDDGVITIREQVAKLQRARLVPLHPTTVQALTGYLSARERLCPQPRSTALLLSGTGTALDRSAVSKTLRTITVALGLRTETVHPRTHDLRHSFAVSTLIGWQRSGVRIDERIAALSTYLGHIGPAETYWYLTATPELMGLAAQRLDRRFGARS
jgi:integrase/recombinase XerD